MAKKQSKAKRKKEKQKRRPRTGCPNCSQGAGAEVFSDAANKLTAWRCDCGAEWAIIEEEEETVYRIKTDAADRAKTNSSWRPMTRAELSRVKRG